MRTLTSAILPAAANGLRRRANTLRPASRPGGALLDVVVGALCILVLLAVIVLDAAPRQRAATTEAVA